MTGLGRRARRSPVLQLSCSESIALDIHDIAPSAPRPCILYSNVLEFCIRMYSKSKCTPTYWNSRGIRSVSWRSPLSATRMYSVFERSRILHSNVCEIEMYSNVSNIFEVCLGAQPSAPRQCILSCACCSLQQEGWLGSGMRDERWRMKDG